MESAQDILDEIIQQFSTKLTLPAPAPPEAGVSFSIGAFVTKHETQREKNNRLRDERMKRLEEQRKAKRRLARHVNKSAPTKVRQWRLLPVKKCPSERSAFCVDLLAGYTYAEKLASLKRLHVPAICPNSPLPPLPMMKETAKAVREIKKEALVLIEQNQALIWKLRCFLHHWRLRRMRLQNQEDPITMTVPKQPILLHSFTQRRMYQYDASSLARTFHLRLLHHDGPFPNPLMPMNPFTNESLGIAQCLSTFKQLQNFASTYWTLQAFQRSGFSLQRFLKAHDKALRTHALKSILWDFQDYDGIDTMFDFIESQHDYHGQTFHKPLYQWYLHKKPDEEKMLQWRRLCQQWYLNDILEADGQHKENVYTSIYEKTESLCEKPLQLLAKRRFLLGKQNE